MASRATYPQRERERHTCKHHGLDGYIHTYRERERERERERDTYQHHDLEGYIYTHRERETYM